MKNLILGAVYFVALYTQAAPYLPDQLELRTTINLAGDLGISGNSMFNPRFFDRNIYANQINTPAFGRYPSGSSTPSLAVDNSSIPLDHRMVAPFRGPNSSIYMLAAGGANNTTFSRYDFDGQNRVDVEVPGGGQAAESFDWVDNNTIIYTTYNPSANRKRLSLAQVVAEPFSVTADTRWNANGFVTTSASTRLRNVRVGDLYSGYAYYGDAGQNNNPKFYAINLATGAETLLGSAGTLTGSGSFGLWTVVERGGYLYVHTTDNGIQVYSLTSATTLGSLATTYTKERLDELTGYTGQYWGFDLSPDGKKLLLGAAQGIVYELAPIPPLRLRTTINLAGDLGISGSSMYNPRLFDGDIYVNQINTPAFGRYPSGSSTPSLAVDNSSIPLDHRMVAPFRGPNSSIYMLAAGGANNTTFSRYDFDGQNRVDVEVPGGGQAAESFDWVDNNTIIYTTYNPSANRKRLSLAQVVAEPFSVTADTRWNANGFVTTSASTRLRNVRVGDLYSGYAYYGDAGQNNNPKFYAINLATGAETLLGSAGTLTGSGSFGLWTVVERGGYLYVHTTDNGIQVYSLTSATTLGSLSTTFTKEDLDTATGYTGQYWGFDVSTDRKTLLLGGAQGLVFELAVQGEEPLLLGISRSGTDVVLSWPAPITAAVIQAASSLSPPNFADLNPQPSVTISQNLNQATIPIGAANVFYRLRK